MTNIIVCRDYVRLANASVHACPPPPEVTAGMITEVTMPQLGLEVTHGTVSALFVEPGAAVTRDQPLLELDTDKASTDVVAPGDGVVRSIDVVVGQEVEIGARLIVLTQTAEEPVGDGSAEEPQAGAPRGGEAPPPRLRVAPVARRAAADLGVELSSINGSGPRGRITLDDVRAAADRPAAPAAVNGDRPPGTPGAPPAEVNDRSRGLPAHSPARDVDPAFVQEASPLRRAIARRMSASQLIPQYQLVRDVDAGPLLAESAARKEAAGSGPGPGVNDLLMQAIAEMVRRHPGLATSYVADPDATSARLIRATEVNVGLAVATDRGLVVPVIRNADTLGLAEIAGRRKTLVSAARAGTLGLPDMSGGTITLSNLGGFGIDRFTAMLNPGEAAIVAVGRTVERLVPRGRAIVVVPTLTVTISFDHRSVDGAVGAAALGELGDLLEGTMVWRP
jgi:pyruvate dehydrogenase E2 component (dihydrolipoamide acetyltransferase)